MNNNKRNGGLLFFVGVVQFVFAVVISEAIYSGYSVGQQYMSDLGDWSLAGNFAVIFDVSIILHAMFIIAGAYFIQRGLRNRLFTSILVLNGVGLVGAGMIAENIFLPVHSFFALVIFLFGAIAVIMSYKFEKSPLSYSSIILGVVMLVALVLFSLGAYVNSGFYLGLGLGGMERFIIYPWLLWMLGFGAFLIGDSSNTATTSKA